MARHPSRASRPTCVTHTLDTVMEQSTQGNRMSLELRPRAKAWLVEGPNLHLFDWDDDLVRTALQHRLRDAFLDQDSQDALRGQVLDRFAITPCAGDRNLKCYCRRRYQELHFFRL